MASTIIIYEGDGTTVDFTVPFDYLKKTFVKVILDNADLTGGNYGDTSVDYYFLDDTTVRLKTAPASGSKLTIRRYTSATDRVVTFKDASILKATDLDMSQLQAFHIAEEARDIINDALVKDKYGNWDARGKRIVNLADPVNDNDALNYGTYKRDKEGVYESALLAEKSKNLAKEWATKTDGLVEDEDYSSKEYAIRSKASSEKAKQSEDNSKASENRADQILYIINDKFDGFEDVFEENKVLIDITDTYLLSLLDTTVTATNRFNEIALEEWYAWKDSDIYTTVSSLDTLSKACVVSRTQTENDIVHYDEAITHRNLLIRSYVESPYVLFLVGGQSNAAGRTMPAYESATYCGKLWDWSANVNTLVDLKDPTNMYRSGYGSAWPAFARTFFELTGRKVIILNTASGGSYVTDYGGSNTWFGEDSSLRLHTTEKYSDMLSYLSGNEIPFELGGLFWIQGEAEALKVGNGTISTDYFKECTINVFDFYKKLTEETELPIFISQVGYQKTVYTNPTLLDGYNKIHTAQKELATELNNTYLAFESAKYFVLSNEMYDEYHYTQYGYNKLGEAFARVSSNILFTGNNYA